MAFNPDKFLAETAPPQKPAFDPDKFLAETDPRAGQGVAGSVRTGARSALEMMSLGLSEPVFSGMHAVDRTFQDAQKAGAGLIHGQDVDFNPLDSLSQGYQEDVDARRKDKEEHGVANVVGGVGGALSPVGPAAALAKGVSGLARGFAAKAAPYIPEIISGSKAGLLAGRVATGAAEGYGTAVGMETPRQVVEGSTGFIKKGDNDVPDLGDVGKVGALIGGGLPLAGAALKGLGAAGKYSGKKLLATFLGPSEAHIDYYLKNPKAVNDAPTMAILKEKVDAVTEKLRGDVENGELSVSEAQAQLKDINDAAQAHRKDSGEEFRRTSWEIKQTFAQAKKDLGEAFKGKVNDLKGVKAPVHLADETFQATKDLKGKIVSGSREATELISPDSRVTNYSPYKVLTAAQEKLSPVGTGPITPADKAAHQAIEELKTTIGELPGEMTGAQAKAVIKRLDKSEEAVYNSAAFTDDVANVYRDLRRELDTQLKAGNPAYAERMKGVADDASLHEEMVPKFGDKGKAASTLNQIAGDTKGETRAGLLKLGKATGRDFETPMNAHLDAQSTLNDPKKMNAIKEGLPEYQKMLEAEKASQLVSHPDAAKEFPERRLQESGLLKQQADAEGLLAQRKEGLIGAEDRAVVAKGLTPGTSQNRLESAGRGLNTDKEKIEAIKQLRELSKLSDTDFVKAIEARATKNAFKGQDINGSRKVNLFSIVMGGIGGAVTSIAGHGMDPAIMAGAASAGAALGGVADKYGPAMTKSMLDAALKIQGSPTLAKIQALQIPPAVKAALAREMADFNQPENK